MQRSAPEYLHMMPVGSLGSLRSAAFPGAVHPRRLNLLPPQHIALCAKLSHKSTSFYFLALPPGKLFYLPTLAQTFYAGAPYGQIALTGIRSFNTVHYNTSYRQVGTKASSVCRRKCHAHGSVFPQLLHGDQPSVQQF